MTVALLDIETFVHLDILDIHYIYACTEGGAHFPIAHALRLPEPTPKKIKLGCVTPFHSGPLATLRFGRRKVGGRKKKGRKRRKE